MILWLVVFNDVSTLVGYLIHIHTCINAHIHTYIHTYIHIWLVNQ